MSAADAGQPQANGPTSHDQANRDSWSGHIGSDGSRSTGRETGRKFPHIKDLKARAGSQIDEHVPVRWTTRFECGALGRS